MGCGDLCTASSMKRFYLVDCNNFFVACEQVFNPKLVGKPVVVLSNNDGCVVSRSQEVKDLGIPMGIALFKIASLVKQHGIQVLSSNYSLYADMSARVMRTLALMAGDMEVYSVDEAFLFAPYTKNHEEYAKNIRAVVKQHTGISVSLGIGSTKTLAKVANRYAKKHPEGVFAITDKNVDEYLEKLPVGDVWGVGYRYNKMLLSNRIKTAKDLKYAEDSWVRKRMTIVGLKMVQELRGTPCLELVDQAPAKQTITVSRSFGKKISDKRQVQEAVASHIICAAKKLRKEKELVSVVSVFIATSRYQETDRYYNTATVTLPVATDYTPALLNAASVCLDAIFKQGYQYKKAGILLHDLVSKDNKQLDLFSEMPDTKEKELMKSYDKITGRFGDQALSYASAGAAAGVDQDWKSKRQKKSPHYTTNWHELLTVE